MESYFITCPNICENFTSKKRFWPQFFRISPDFPGFSRISAPNFSIFYFLFFIFIYFILFFILFYLMFIFYSAQIYAAGTFHIVMAPITCAVRPSLAVVKFPTANFITCNVL